MNALFAGKHVIKDIQYSNNERTSTTKDGRTIIHDIYCITDTGERLIVEMQNKSMKNIKDRALYYTAKSVVDQGEPGDEWRYSVNAVYGIFFLNFLLKDAGSGDSDNCLSEVTLMNTDTKVVFNDKFKQYYIELPLFAKTEQECVTEFDKWIYILKNMDTMDRMPFKADRNEVFARLEKTARRTNLTKEEREDYEAEWKFYNDYFCTIDYAKSEGHEEGRAEGRAEGHAEGIVDVAKAMKEQGCSIQLIVSCTGLSAGEIEKL